MNSKRIWATLLVLSTLGPHCPGVWAQLPDMAVCSAGFLWNENSLGQDPCSISSLLDATCRGVGSYTIPALNSTQNYVPPQGDNVDDLNCDCDTVMYSLYMACTSCQGGIIYSWPTWAAQCESVYVTQYPHNIPYGTAIPHWAFYDVTTIPTKTYNDSIAISVGRNPEATPAALSTATFGTSTSHSGPSSFTSSGSKPGSSNTNDDTSSSKVPIAAIVGGAVGAIVVLILIIVIVTMCLRRRNPSGGSQHPPPHPPPVHHTQEYKPEYHPDYQKVQPVSPVFSPVTPNHPHHNPTSPNPMFNTPTGYNLSFSAQVGQNPQFSAQVGTDPSFNNNPAGQNPQFNNPVSQNPQYTDPGNQMPQYSDPASQVPQYNDPSQNPQFNNPASQNPQFNGSYYNPEDPTTFPPPMGDGQSSVTYTNPGQGLYGGVAEL